MSYGHRGVHHRGYLPHVDRPGVIQAVTFRLWDSLPAHVTEAIATGEGGDDEVRSRMERRLNNGYGACLLREPRIAQIVLDALRFFDGRRYRLIAWVIMPNHVHVIIRVVQGWPLEKVVHSWKSYTANRANHLLGRTGRFWYPDYYDRIIRDDAHLAAAIQYVHNNPVQAGLAATPEEWPFSSASAT